MPSALTLCNAQQCLQDLDSFIIKHLMCAQYLPQWSTVLEVWISVQRFPVSGHTGVLDSSPSPHLVLFPGTGPRWRSKEKIMVASGMLGISVSFIPYLYLSWFHKGFELVVWDYKKKQQEKVAEENFSFAIAKARTTKWMFTSDEDLGALRGPARGFGACLWGQDGLCCRREPRAAAPCIATAVWPWAGHVPLKNAGNTPTLQGYYCV